MIDRTTAMDPASRAWRREQMERSNDIESLAPLDTEDQAFAAEIFSQDMTGDERIAAIIAYGKAKDDRVTAAKAFKKAS